MPAGWQELSRNPAALTQVGEGAKGVGSRLVARALRACPAPDGHPLAVPQQCLVSPCHSEDGAPGAWPAALATSPPPGPSCVAWAAPASTLCAWGCVALLDLAAADLKGGQSAQSRELQGQALVVVGTGASYLWETESRACGKCYSELRGLCYPNSSTLPTLSCCWWPCHKQSFPGSRCPAAL